MTDVGAVMQELRLKGGPKSITDEGDGILGCFEHPDGNELCLWQYKTNFCDREQRRDISNQKSRSEDQRRIRGRRSRSTDHGA